MVFIGRDLNEKAIREGFSPAPPERRAASHEDADACGIGSAIHDRDCLNDCRICPIALAERAPLDARRPCHGARLAEGHAGASASAMARVLLSKDGEIRPRRGASGRRASCRRVSDGARFVTGGDDGRVAATGADGSTRTLAETKGAWIDSLAVNAGGAFAYGGRQTRDRP